MKALIIEDEPKIANAIARGLKQENFIVETCEDGESGLAAVLGDEYDVIILDRMLPEMEGLEVCRQIRKNGIMTPILILTAKSQIRDRVEGLNAGADDYLIKPFSFEELLARVRALLRRPSDVIDDVLHVKDLTLNTTNFEVQRQNEVIKLTRTEYALLEYLMRNADQILTKDQIINHVWDFEADILPNTVEANISSLRRKIDKPFKSQPLIQTYRGFGYKIGAV